jgi:hypothetical protein
MKRSTLQKLSRITGLAPCLKFKKMKNTLAYYPSISKIKLGLGSTVVEHQTQNWMIKSSNPTTGTGKGKNGNNLTSMNSGKRH